MFSTEVTSPLRTFVGVLCGLIAALLIVGFGAIVVLANEQLKQDIWVAVTAAIVLGGGLMFWFGSYKLLRNPPARSTKRTGRLTFTKMVASLLFGAIAASALYLSIEAKSIYLASLSLFFLVLAALPWREWQSKR